VCFVALAGLVGGLLVAGPELLSHLAALADAQQFYADQFPNEAVPGPSIRFPRGLVYPVTGANPGPALGLLFAGFFAVLLVRPADRAGELVAGGAAGLIAVLLGLAFSGAGDSLDAPVGDVNLLAQEAGQLAAGGRQQPAWAVADKYPDLGKVPAAERAQALARKINTDLRLHFWDANATRVVAMLVQIPFCLALALYAGRLRRQYPRILALTCVALALAVPTLELESLCPPPGQLLMRPISLFALNIVLWPLIVIGIRHCLRRPMVLLLAGTLYLVVSCILAPVVALTTGAHGGDLFLGGVLFLALLGLLLPLLLGDDDRELSR
jgi:hypothetical protein